MQNFAKQLEQKLPKWLQLVFIFVLLALVVVFVWQASMQNALGEADFIGYWSAVYLVSQGQNPYDFEAMTGVQKGLLQVPESEPTIMSWNPPTLFAFLLPLAWAPYTVAKTLWLLVNIVVIVLVAGLLAQIYLADQSAAARLGFILIAGAFPPVLSAIKMGQVTFLVTFGLVLSMFFIQRERWFWGGAALIFTTIKPHLVILAWVFILLSMIKQKKILRGIGGGFLALVICAVLLFVFRPQWVHDFWGLLGMPPTRWIPPTIGGLLTYYQVTSLGRYLVFVLLPLPAILVYRKKIVDWRVSLALLTALTVPFTFFGWSYDHTILLIPIAQVLQWVAQMEKGLQRWISIMLIGVSMLAHYAVAILTRNDVHFVWIALLWLIVFAVTGFFVFGQAHKPTSNSLVAEVTDA